MKSINLVGRVFSRIFVFLYMNKTAKILSIVFVFALSSCYNEEQFPDTPLIEFRSLEFVDTQTSDSLILKFHFEDGGANLGLPENDFSAQYLLYVDSEPKILTANNIDQAIGPIFVAPIFFEQVVLESFFGNTFSVRRSDSTYPAILDTTKFADDTNEIVFDCPNLINQNLLLFDTVDIALYSFNEPLFQEILVQDIDSEVPALYLESYYNLILKFERIVNGEVVEIDFREEFGSTDCTRGDFNARIPLFDSDGESGTITYNIISFLIRLGIGDDPFQIRFYVYDRSGNKSNEVVSPIYRLSEITRN